jgi:hypothetical protein
MKRITLVLALLCLSGAAQARPYFRPGFDAISGGVLFPLAGSLDQGQGFVVVPAIVHSAKDGYLVLPGVDWNLLDLGYAGPVGGGSDFRKGSVVAGPSLHLGEPVKDLLRSACRLAIPGWSEAGRFGALKAAFAPGAEGVYINLGPSVVWNLGTKQFGVMGALTLNKRFQ